MPRPKDNRAVFRKAEIDLATLSTYDLHLLPEEVDRIRDYIELPKFRAWLYEHGKKEQMTAELLGQCQQLQTGDIFDCLGWPRDILALRLPLYDDGATLEGVIFPKLLVKVARVINKTREEATSVRDVGAKDGPSKGREQRLFMWMLLLTTSVMAVLVIWLGDSHSWVWEDAVDTVSQLFAHLNVSIDRLLSDIHVYFHHMYIKMAESAEERPLEGSNSG